jgi:hypothetical protein
VAAAALVFVVFVGAAVDAAAAVEVLEPLDPVITKYFISPSRCSPSHNHFTPFVNEIVPRKHGDDRKERRLAIATYLN